MRRVETRPKTHEERLRRNLATDARAEGVDPGRFVAQLAQAVRERIWERLVDDAGHPLTARQFLEAPYPTGIGLDADVLRQLVALPQRRAALPAHLASTRALARDLDRLLLDPLAAPGRPIAACPSKPDNANDSRVSGSPARRATPNSREYVIRRLLRDNPALAERVLAGELSAHAAAIAAGFRRPATALRQAVQAWERMSSQERERFLALIGGLPDTAANP